MEAMLPNATGIGPVSLLLARSSSWSLESRDNFEGISPVKLFDLRLRILNDGTRVPIHGGMAPKNLLFPMSRVVSESQ